MGHQLSKPVTEKVSSDDSNGTLIWGASSMQGWRRTYEDAHNCILDFDTNTSYFAVYDGHLGQEVALYCSENLPQFLKQVEAYKNGDMKKALEDCFLEFDATITFPEVKERLKELAQVKRSKGGESEDETVEEDTSNTKSIITIKLKESASVFEPSDKSNSDGLDNIVSSSSSTKNEAPNLIMEKSDNLDNTVGSSSSTMNEEHNLTPEKSDSLDIVDNSRSLMHEAPNLKSEKLDSSDNIVDSSSSPMDETPNLTTEKTDSSYSIVGSPGSPMEEAPNLTTDKSDSSDNVVGDSSSPMDETPNLTSENSDNSDNIVGSSSSPMDEPSNLTAEKSNSSDNIVGSSSSPMEEASNLTTDKSGSKKKKRKILHLNKVGSRSGCTALVALLHENELYVANAGDSRCIVCRNGKVIEMSFDHKPLNKDEYERIVKAGGSVDDCKGRINNTLNLSRAIGDHRFKQNKDLSNREQMITALPDIQTLTINPNEDEFMFLACDGIWNCLSNQQVVDIIRPAIREGKKKLSQVCEELFDTCLKRVVVGRDNMTAIIVQFNSHVLKRSAEESDCTEALITKENVDTDAM